MSQHDPVMSDLNRHLNRLDREDADSEWADEIAEEWMTDGRRVLEALEALVEDTPVEEILDPLNIAAVGLAADAEARQLAIFKVYQGLEEKIKAKLLEDAPAEVEKRKRQAEDDHAEDVMEAREFDRMYGHD